MKAPEHFLLSMPLGDGNHLHAYVMTVDRDALGQVTNRMISQMEDIGYWLASPVCMQSLLDKKGVKQVRTFLVANFSDSRELLKEAKDFHISSWGMPDDHPDAEWILKLH